MVRAAECLEREASATKDPDARLRLFDALGDLALGVLDDPERAERCWSRVAGAMHAPVLEKLLALQRKRGSKIERGETCERLAAVTEDPRIVKELTEEAAQAFLAGGDLARALAVADYLMSAHPHDADTVTCASKIAVACGEHERAAGWLRRALGAWEAAGNHGDGDPRRADLWRTLGDAERTRKNERAALDAYQRAVVTSPDSDGALAARRGLIELASSFGRSASTSRLALVEAEQAPEDIIASARDLAGQHAFEDARAMYELARAVGVELLAEDEHFLATHPARPMASDEAYAAALDETERRLLVEEPGEGPIGDLMLLLGEAANLVCPDARTALDLEALCDAKRIAASSEAAVVAMYPQIAKALGGPPTLLYADPSRSGPDLRLLLAAPPVLLVGPRLAAVRARSRSDYEEDVDAELRFRLGRIVELARPHRLFVAGGDRDSFARLVAGLWHAFGKPDVAAPDDVAREADRLRHALPLALRRRMTERLATVPATALDIQTYVASCQRAADRAGLVACGHTAIALHLAGGRDAAPHLVQLAASNKYRAARRKLRRT
jgi:tetratricopeptide (TPR) repeat protein